MNRLTDQFLDRGGRLDERYRLVATWPGGAAQTLATGATLTGILSAAITLSLEGNIQDGALCGVRDDLAGAWAIPPEVTT